MSRTVKRIDPSMLVEGTELEIIPHWRPLKDTLDVVLLSTLFRGKYMGGSKVAGLLVNADGDYDLPGWEPIPIDNLNAQISGFTDANGATLAAQVRYLLRVSNAAISATPKLRYGAAFGDIAVEGSGTAATLSGTSACSTTTEDYSGHASQYQTATITLPSGVKLWKPQVTIAGTGGNPYTVWALALLDVYIQSTS